MNDTQSSTRTTRMSLSRSLVFLLNWLDNGLDCYYEGVLTILMFDSRGIAQEFGVFVLASVTLGSVSDAG